jgi:hypothetical protein
VIVDAALNPPGSELRVVANTAEAARGGPAEFHPVGSRVTVQRAADGTAFVSIRDVPASEALVLLNHP